MKLRLDYVTNSSSSSYIFKDKKEFEKVWEKWKEEFPEWFRDDEWGKIFRMEGLRVLPMKEHSVRNMFYVLIWYQDDIYRKIFADYPKKGAESCKTLEEYRASQSRFVKILDDREWTDKQLGMITMILLIYCMEDKGIYVGVEQVVPSRIEYIDFEKYLWAMLSKEKWPDDCLLQYAFSHYGVRILELAEEYVKKEAGELFSELLDAEYMCFEENEMEPEIDKWLSSVKDCMYACNHMG